MIVVWCGVWYVVCGVWCVSGVGMVLDGSVACEVVWCGVVWHGVVFVLLA